MARGRRWLAALGLLALLFAPGALAAVDGDDLGPAALAPTFSTAELGRAPTPSPAVPVVPVPALVAVVALLVGVALVARTAAPPPSLLLATPVGRRGPPRPTT
jgi:hypothetical protein